LATRRAETGNAEWTAHQHQLQAESELSDAVRRSR
jgi:hypothetical protein